MERRNDDANKQAMIPRRFVIDLPPRKIELA